jgi:hypothetical protein
MRSSLVQLSSDGRRPLTPPKTPPKKQRPDATVLVTPHKL